MSASNDSDPRELSSQALLARLQAHALENGDRDDSQRWEWIHELFLRGDATTFEQARAWGQHANPLLRMLAADLLGQLGLGEGAELVPSQDVLKVLLTMIQDEHAEVLACALIALGHRPEKGWPAASLRALASHPDSDVRYAVAHALGSYGIEESPDAQSILLGLAVDVCDEVRDWSLFALAVQSEWDSPVLRRVLVDGLADSYEPARLEAMVALAMRQDSRAIPVVQAELEQVEVHKLAVEAAGLFPQACFIAPLERLHGRQPEEEEVLAALQACQACR